MARLDPSVSSRVSRTRSSVCGRKAAKVALSTFHEACTRTTCLRWPFRVRNRSDGGGAISNRGCDATHLEVSTSKSASMRNKAESPLVRSVAVSASSMLAEGKDGGVDGRCCAEVAA